MKNKGLLLLLGLLVLIWGAAPVLAKSVSLSEDHDFTVGVAPGALTLPGQLNVFAEGTAFNPAEALNATMPGPVFLDTTKAQTSLDLFHPQFRLEQNQSNGPGGFGLLYQATGNGFDLYLTSPNTGPFKVATDKNGPNYQLSNTAGGYVYDSYANTDLTANLTPTKNSSNSSSSGPASIWSGSKAGATTPGNFLPDRLANFNIALIDSRPADTVLALQLNFLQPEKLPVSLDSNCIVDTTSTSDPVPIPPSLWLFGGLGGLLLAGRRLIRA